MAILKKVRRKKNILKVAMRYRAKGYPFWVCKKWGRRVHYDLITDNGKSKSEKRWAHKRGFLSGSIDKYGLTDENYKKYFSDFEYSFVSSINNAYEKWLKDRLTPYYILQNYTELLPEIYFNIIKRDDEIKVISLPENRVVSFDEIIKCLQEKKTLELLPSQKSYTYKSYLMEYKNEEYYINSEKVSINDIYDLFENLSRYYIVRERICMRNDIKNKIGNKESQIRFILRNQANHTPLIMSAFLQEEREYVGGFDLDRRFENRNLQSILINIESGAIQGKSEDPIPEWEKISQCILKIADYISEIEYMMIAVKITDFGIKIVEYGIKPGVPPGASSEDLTNLYLKSKAEDKQSRLQNGEIAITRPFKWKVLKVLKRRYFKKGFREYMLAVWLNTVKDDFFNTKGVPLYKKIWAWKRGFPSYRIEQYGLNNRNWKSILSDYDYAWLNRINNTYQKWINDKTTMRYVLQPVKKYLPEYYFFVGKRDDDAYFKMLQDCPDDIEENFNGILNLLKREGRLVFKPNAGTHGDGFYKLEYIHGQYFVNGEIVNDKEVQSVICEQRSTYVITEYIEMHSDLKKIYPQSVNTIRVMVLNQSCENPHIVQTYMRVGSSKTGLTDNIAYGGLAVYVDKNDGFYYGAALLMDHKYISTSVHPDTGVKLEGYLPNWEIVKEGVLQVSHMMPQLEYLGFDIAITEMGFKILEINIHQDIHKAHEFTDEINTFFKRKKSIKELRHQI